jgi:hypothetical protein
MDAFVRPTAGTEPAAARPLAGLRLLLDPGRGAPGPGSQTPASWTLAVAQRLTTRCLAAGAAVALSRTTAGAVPAPCRRAFVAAFRPDLSLGIHAGAATARAPGLRWGCPWWQRRAAAPLAAALADALAAHGVAVGPTLGPCALPPPAPPLSWRTLALVLLARPGLEGDLDVAAWADALADGLAGYWAARGWGHPVAEAAEVSLPQGTAAAPAPDGAGVEPVPPQRLEAPAPEVAATAVPEDGPTPAGDAPPPVADPAPGGEPVAAPVPEAPTRPRVPRRTPRVPPLTVPLVLGLRQEFPPAPGGGRLLQWAAPPVPAARPRSPGAQAADGGPGAARRG